MAVEFHNNFGTVGSVHQAETMTIHVGNMTFGGQVPSVADLQRQIADLEALLAQQPDVPEETRAAAAQALAEAKETPPGEPDASGRIVEKLKGAKSLLQAATGAATQVAPLITAIGAVIGAASGLAF